MGLFDAFKKKVEEKSEEINPIYEALKTADLGVDNLQVANNNGTARVSGTVQNGEAIAKVEEFVKSQTGVTGFENAIEIADVSDLNIRYTVATNSSNLNVRKGAGTDFDIVGKFPKGTEVTLVKRINNTWFIVRTEELEGYCHTDYLKLA